MDRRREQRPTTEGPRGFTLVEVLVAALLFAIGMIALVAMELSALGGYASARDLSKGTQVGQRVLQIARLEAQQWRQNTDLSNVEFPYHDTTTSDNAMTNVDGSLLQMADSWTWERVFTQPVDERLTTTGAQRFCVYVRGGSISSGSSAGGAKRRVQVAVVYAGPSGRVADDSGECPSDGDSIDVPGQSSSVTLTDALTIDADGRVAAETAGFRVVMLGGVIRQRVHLGS